jgi:trehalose 6-phosphate phosphatase
MSSDPTIMSATPATPRMIGSAHEERRFTVPESSRQTDASPVRALALAREALDAEPAGLLTDFDGTLSPIVHDPFMAGLVDGAAGALSALAERLAVVAIITGRMPLDARRLVGVPGVLIAGNHGTEWLDPDAAEPTVAPGAGAIARALDEALARVPPLPGVVVDHKGVSASVHYRQAPDPAAAREAIIAALGDLEELGLRLAHGRMIVEIRPADLGDKGTAARAIVERFGLRGVVVMGDDTTDLDMFASVAALRASGRLRAAIVAVGGSDHDVLPEVAAAADVVLDAPAEAGELLARLANDR